MSDGGNDMCYITEFSDYLLYQRNYSPNTADSYTRDINQMKTALKVDLTLLEEDDICKYFSGLGKLGLSISSRNRKLSAVKKYYSYLTSKGIIKRNPALGVEGGKREARLPKPIESNDITFLFNKVDNIRDRTMLEVLYATGARREEISKMKLSHINFNYGSIVIIGKGNKERMVPIHQNALKMITDLMATQDSDWLFPSTKYPGRHISNRQVNEIITKWVKEANLEGKHITPHSFRHSFCSHLFANGADIKAIRDMAGHSSTSTTELYTKVNIDRNKKEYTKYHPGAV